MYKGLLIVLPQRR